MVCIYLEHYTLSSCPQKGEGELGFAHVCISCMQTGWPEEPLTIKALISHHPLHLLLVPWLILNVTRWQIHTHAIATMHKYLKQDIMPRWKSELALPQLWSTGQTLGLASDLAVKKGYLCLLCFCVHKGRRVACRVPAGILECPHEH